MMEVPYQKIGEAMGVSTARQAELLGNLLLYATRSETATGIETLTDAMAEETDPVEETIPLLKWIAAEPSLTGEERIFLAHRIGILLPLPTSEDNEEEEYIIDEEDLEMREILRAFLQSDEGQDLFHPIIEDLEGDESEEDESGGM